VSVGTMLKNSRLMSPSAHICVYLVHAITCKWLTIPRNCNWGT
jgi:hypothetical protein